MKRILGALEDTQSLRGAYILRSTLIICLPAILAALVGQAVGLHSLSGIPDEHWPIASKELRFAMTLVSVVVFGPLIETALCFLPILELQRFKLSNIWIAILASLGWGVLHVWRGSFIQIVSIWSFFCFTIMLQALDVKSRDRAWIQVPVVHGLSNVAVLLICVPFWIYGN